MHLIRNLTEARLTNPTVLTIGTFDGLHLGHQALLAQLKTAARRRQAQTAVITFHPRPKTVLAPDRPHNDYLTTPEERIALFATLGLDVLILIPFTLEFAQTTAYDFMKYLTDRIDLVELWSGHDFALGKNREGNVARLAELGQEFNYTVHTFTPVLVNGQVVSSTQIRQLLLAGQVRQAGQLLGRYPSISGQVVAGAKRGRMLGFPTANLAPAPERLLPAHGVYATFVRRDGENGRLTGVTNIGLRPSFEGDRPTVETYIFDFDDDLYGQQLTLELVEYLRPEKKFNGINELMAQIGADSARARDILAEEISHPSRLGLDPNWV
jgi:riboflavin kinase/FMN adenylyltransferase